MASTRQLPGNPDSQNGDDVPSLIRRTALSAMPFVSDLCRVNLSWIQFKSSHLSVSSSKTAM